MLDACKENIMSAKLDFIQSVSESLTDLNTCMLANVRLQHLRSAKERTKDKHKLREIDIQIALITNFILALESLGVEE